MLLNRVIQRHTLKTLNLYNNLSDVNNLHEMQCLVVLYYVGELCCRSVNIPHAFIFLTDYRAEFNIQY